MAKSKLDLMYKKEQEEELKKKYGVKQTTPNVKILMGRNEEKMKKLTGDPNFGSTVKNAFVKGATLQAQNQTALAQNIAKNVQNVVQSYGTANAAYGDAYTRQAENVGNAARKTASHWANANAANSEAHLQMGQQLNKQKNRVEQKYGPIWGMTTGSTGSDQTGASIWGYRNDTRMEEPRSDWDVAARKEHRALKRTNPEAAGAFAIEVNEGLNRAERERKARALQNWVSESGANGAAAWVGGRGLNQISPLDSYNESLERAAIGVNREKSQLTATDIKEIIDDTNARNIEERFGKLGSLAYTAGSNLTDILVSKGLSGKNNPDKNLAENVFALSGAMESGYQKAKESGREKLGLIAPTLAYGFSGLVEMAINQADDEDGVLKEIAREVVGKAVDGKIKAGSDEWFDLKRDEIDRMTEEYVNKNKTSEKRARYKVTRKLLEKEGRW